MMIECDLCYGCLSCVDGARLKMHERKIWHNENAWWKMGNVSLV